MLGGFIYPNEAETQWSVFIVLYPYITGLVAGAFIVSAFYHVFGISQLKTVARFSLVAALAFLLVAPLPLLAHLGRLERGIVIFLTPHFSSAMAGFGFIWMSYLILVVSEVWLVFRKDIVAYARSSRGPKKLLYSALALGVYDLSEAALRIDSKLIKVLATIGVPAAAILHGYVGFIFGAIKANPWWSTPLMPFIFLLSAIVSGIALLIVLYVVVTRIRRKAIDHECVGTMMRWWFGFLILDIVFEGMEVLSMFYESEESWQILAPLITQKLRVTYIGIQMGLGALIPLLVLGFAGALKISQKVRTSLGFFCSLLVLVGVLAMRWNVVIGGQLFSKSLRGFTSYTPPLLGREGLLAAGTFLLLPFLILGVLTYLLPPWREEPEAPQLPPPARGFRSWRVAMPETKSPEA